MIAEGLATCARAMPCEAVRATTALNFFSRANSTIRRAKFRSSSIIKRMRSPGCKFSRSSSMPSAGICEADSIGVFKGVIRCDEASRGGGSGASVCFVVSLLDAVHVTGRSRVNVLPRPGSLVTRIAPWSSRANSRLIERPSPVPP